MLALDYERIYREFIADRRSRPQPDGYTENHHILPRSLGGSDDKSNMIRMTPEDHYFAHLLLAKIHGGKMWDAIHAMRYLANGDAKVIRSRLHCRFMFGHVRRALSEHFSCKSSGLSNAAADHAIYELRHFDGRVSVGKRVELARDIGLSVMQISTLILGARKSCFGWYYPIHNPRGLKPSELKSEGLRSKETFRMFHFDGREWKGTRVEFRSMTGLQLHWNRDDHLHIAGWHKSRSDAALYHQRVTEMCRANSRSRGDISGDKNPMFGRDRRKDMNVRLAHASGRVYEGSLKVLADLEGFNASQFANFKKVITGKRIVNGFKIKSFKGWSVAA